MYRFYNGDIVSLSSEGHNSKEEDDFDNDTGSEESESDSVKKVVGKHLPLHSLSLAEVEAPPLD